MARYVPRALRGRSADGPEPTEEFAARRREAENAAESASEPVSGSSADDGDATGNDDATANDDEATPKDGDATAKNGDRAAARRRRPQPRAAASDSAPAADDADGAAEDVDPAEGQDVPERDAERAPEPDEPDADVEPEADDKLDAEDEDVEPEADDEPEDEDAEREKPRSGRIGAAAGRAKRGRSTSDDAAGRTSGARGPAGRKVAAPRARMSRRAREAEAAVARLRRTAAAIGVWALIFALLAGGAYYLKSSAEATARADREATAAAAAAAEAIFSYDYRSFDDSVANGLAFTTGDFKKEYRKTTGSLKATAVKEKAVVRANVKLMSVADRPADCGEDAAECVEVLLYVNQFRTNANIKGEKVDQNRVVLTMVRIRDEKTGHDWLVRDALAI
ncbi:MAG: hypothetical protein GEU94_00065 [Micromonosporaceae bacterium]|nr:hypothetical protein [Micromonosporaceae bacterium]